jgi:hypothetical protein
MTPHPAETGPTDDAAPGETGPLMAPRPAQAGPADDAPLRNAYGDVQAGTGIAAAASEADRSRTVLRTARA